MKESWHDEGGGRIKHRKNKKFLREVLEIDLKNMDSRGRALFTVRCGSDV